MVGGREVWGGRLFFRLSARRGSDILAAGACAQREGCPGVYGHAYTSLIHFMEGNAMATYVTLYNFTEKGAREIKDTVKRVEAAKAAAKQIGVTIKEVLWLQGQYDIVVITEGSDEIAMNALGLNTIKLGNVHGQTMRAFTAAEMAKILEKVA